MIVWSVGREVACDLRGEVGRPADLAGDAPRGGLEIAGGGAGALSLPHGSGNVLQLSVCGSGMRSYGGYREPGPKALRGRFGAECRRLSGHRAGNPASRGRGIETPLSRDGGDVYK